MRIGSSHTIFASEGCGVVRLSLVRVIGDAEVVMLELLGAAGEEDTTGVAGISTGMA